ncbi:hypothetical protein CNEO4_90043 [Clostridium neonatale]|uniref:Uncharacterized protein n=1 Tax=Clostridium neonatale TaxID=137838 RepID=A0AA86JU43_9CLOT|nr:hypothetical protein CNEO_40718 [Clostridium neonatale]CAI3554615.1 hypothetical protein CNEO4_110106 [Clostridium neonatale]CAI3581860.1 hypothetical protein CNEO4_110106 [Clostridium neonatale]CAI3631106.1 hypothetical protein CNEO3_20106 [Clostridium neonatale]CAI3716892.1 hypothetical protein CNEO4_80047 [Clostridium neonatale]
MPYNFSLFVLGRHFYISNTAYITILNRYYITLKILIYLN